jgi:hypothetical protein
MRVKAVPIGIALLLVTAGALGLVVAPSITMAQGTAPQGGMNGMSMMGGMGMMGGPFPATARPISIEQAVQSLRQWPAAHHLDDLVLDEVEAYTQNFYGQFKERSTGRGALQLLVDRYTGRVMPEMGPNMMWNTKYGHAMMQEMMGGMDMMGGPGMMNNMGMMGAAPATPPAPTISDAQAKQAATQFLAGYLPGARVGDGDAFYGYYHFDVLRGIRQVGMLSVNAASGQVWYHTWHGEFLEKREIR